MEMARVSTVVVAASLTSVARLKAAAVAGAGLLYASGLAVYGAALAVAAFRLWG